MKQLRTTSRGSRSANTIFISGNTRATNGKSIVSSGFLSISNRPAIGSRSAPLHAGPIGLSHEIQIVLRRAIQDLGYRVGRFGLAAQRNVNHF